MQCSDPCIERPFSRIDGVNCRPKLDAKLLNRGFHRSLAGLPNVSNAIHRFFRFAPESGPTPDLRTTSAASSWRTPPSRPRASPRTCGLACGPHDAQRPKGSLSSLEFSELRSVHQCRNRPRSSGRDARPCSSDNHRRRPRLPQP